MLIAKISDNCYLSLIFFLSAQYWLTIWALLPYIVMLFSVNVLKNDTKGV
jgi:hypothetical protein